MPTNRFDALPQRFIRETEDELNLYLESAQDPYQAYIDLIEELIQAEHVPDDNTILNVGLEPSSVQVLSVQVPSEALQPWRKTPRFGPSKSSKHVDTP